MFPIFGCLHTVTAEAGWGAGVPFQSGIARAGGAQRGKGLEIGRETGRKLVGGKLRNGVGNGFGRGRETGRESVGIP